MSAVVRAVKKVVSAVGKAVKKVVTAVVNTVKAAVRDPIATIAKVAAYATGNAWAIPLIDGASVLAKGGKIGDAIKSAVISYGTGKIATKIGTPVGNAASSFAAAQGVSTSAQNIINTLVSRSVGAGAVAIVTKQDPVKAFVAGGVSAATSAVLGQVPGFVSQPRWVQNTVSSSVGALVSGQQNFDEAASAILVSASGIVTNAMRAFDPNGTKMTEGQRAIAADAIFKTTTAALAGRSPTAALSQSLTNAATQALGEFATSKLNSSTQGLAEAYARLSGYGNQLDSIAEKSKKTADRFNNVNDSLNAAIAEQSRLFQEQQNARNTYDADPNDAKYNAAQAAVKRYNDYVSSFNKSYNEYYKPTLDSLSSEIRNYQTQYDKLTGVTSAEQKALKDKIDGITNSLNPIYANSNRAFAEGLMPGFDANAYRELNPNLSKDADPYLHYITTGQYEGLKGTREQLRQSKEIVQAILSNPNVDEKALEQYINSGLLSKQYAEYATNKSYDDLINSLDNRVTTEEEAKQFFKDIYGREATSEYDMSVVKDFSNIAEENSKRSLYAAKLIEDDNAMFVYDGSEAGSQEKAKEEARSKGYNTYSFDGKTFTIPPEREVSDRVELGKEILASQGKNLSSATNEDIYKAMELANRVPQNRLGTVSVQDVLNGNYGGWREGKYYEYAGDKLQGVYAIDPQTGKYTLERVEISGGAPKISTTAPRELQELAAEDPESYLQLAKKMDASVQGDLGNFFVNSLNAALLAAETTGNKALASSMRQTFSVLSQGLGEQVENLATFFVDRVGMSRDSAVISAAKAMQQWGAANQSSSTKTQEDAIKSAVSSAEGVGGKIAAFVSSVYDNPGGFATLISKQGVQEIMPLWAASAAYKLGTLAAYGANTAIEAMEAWGGGVKETYDRAKAMGYSEEEARVMGSKVGLQSAFITTVTNGFGDVPLVKRVIGEAARDSLAGITKAGVREGVTEYFDSFGQNAVTQYQLNKTVNWDQAMTAATVGMGIGAGTTSGIMLGAAINSSAPIGLDAQGNPVTFGDFLSGSKQINMGTLDLNAPVATAKDGDQITFGAITSMPMASGISYDVIKSGLPPSLANINVAIGKDALGNNVTLSDLMSGVNEQNSFDMLYRNLLTTSQDESYKAQSDFLRSTLEKYGYNPTDAEIQSLIQERAPGSDALSGAAQSYADVHTVTYDEASKMLSDAYAAQGFTDYTPTEDEIKQFIGSSANVDQSVTGTKVSEFVDIGTTTKEEAQQMMRDLGYTSLTDAEAVAMAGRIKEDQAKTNIEQYISGRMVTREEAQQFFNEYGYVPTEEELNQFIRQGADIDQSAVQAELGQYVDPRLVDDAEVRAAYEALGFKTPLDMDVRRLMGQYSEDELAAKAQENLYPARFNYVSYELEEANRKIKELQDQAGQAQPTTPEQPGQTGGTGVQTPPSGPTVSPSLAAIMAASGQQALLGQIPFAYQALQETTKPIYGGEIKDLDLSSPLDVNFFDVRKETQDGQKQQQATKIAAGGYVDNLLAGDMTADDLLNLLR